MDVGASNWERFADLPGPASAAGARMLHALKMTTDAERRRGQKKLNAVVGLRMNLHFAI